MIEADEAVEVPRPPVLVSVAEGARVYHYPNGKTLRVENVVKFGAPGTTHRLESRDGRKWIIAPGWIAVELIGVERWSV